MGSNSTEALMHRSMAIRRGMVFGLALLAWK